MNKALRMIGLKSMVLTDEVAALDAIRTLDKWENAICDDDNHSDWKIPKRYCNDCQEELHIALEENDGTL